MSRTLAHRVILIASGLLLAAMSLPACGSTPDGDGRTRRTAKGRFVDGPEFRRASARKAEAIEHHKEAFATMDPGKRDTLLARAYSSCRDAQEEYERAIGRYPAHQREAIEFQMDSVHNLMIEIQRDRRHSYVR